MFLFRSPNFFLLLFYIVRSKCVSTADQNIFVELSDLLFFLWAQRTILFFKIREITMWATRWLVLSPSTIYIAWNLPPHTGTIILFHGHNTQLFDFKKPCNQSNSGVFCEPQDGWYFHQALFILHETCNQTLWLLNFSMGTTLNYLISRSLAIEVILVYLISRSSLMILFQMFRDTTDESNFDEFST